MAEFSYLAPETFLYCTILGLLIGLVTSTLGIGGGIFMVPLLPLFFHITLHEAVATSLFTIFLVTMFNTLVFHREKSVRWRVGLWLGIPASAVAFFIPSLAVKVPEMWIQLSLIIIMVGMALVTFAKRRSLTDQFIHNLTLPLKLKCLGIGGMVGALSGFSGLGGGLFITPFLISEKLIYARELTPTINLTAMLTTTMGSIGYLIMDWQGQGYIYFPLAWALFLVASLSGIYFKRLQPMIPIHWKAKIIAFILAIMAGKVAWAIVFRVSG